MYPRKLHTTPSSKEAAFSLPVRTSTLWQIGVILVLSLLLLISMLLRSGSDLCLRLYIDGKYAGAVSSPAVMQEAMDRISLENALDRTAVGKMQTSYSFGRLGRNEELLDESDCFALLSAYIDHTYTAGYLLTFGQKTLAHLEKEEDAKEIVSRLSFVIADSLSGREDIDISDIEALYQISPVICEKATLKDPDTVYNMLYAALEEELSALPGDGDGAVSPGEDIPADSTVPGRVNAFLSDKTYLYEQYYAIDVLRNPTLGILVSDELQSMLNGLEQSFVTVSTEVSTELIPYKTVYIETANEYVGYSKVQTVGENGLREITYEVKTVAGQETSRSILSSRVIAESVDAVIVIGTKPYPKPIPTGTYVWPLRTDRYITSYFGWRPDPFTGEYKYHNGMDIYAPKNTPVYAMDGGEVITAGWEGTYGLCVMIDHGNGLVTLYAHLNAITVEDGDLVYQGQQVGKVGDTGRATGYHLHLEARLWNKRVDPLDYLPD